MTDRPLEKSTVEVLGHRMAYHERGEGASILLLHGNPTSSYIWRNVLPPLEGLGRLIVPDLIGMGDSAKLPGGQSDTYRFGIHRDHLQAFIGAVIGEEKEILLVGHDWGGVLAFDWANRHRDRVRGIVYMETVVRPIMPGDGASDLRPILAALRSEQGERLILEENMFVERVLPDLTMRTLSEVEMAEYRRPFRAAEDRWPTLTWPREIPIAGAPADVAAIIADYARWMAGNDVPKLFVNAAPGMILTGAFRDFCREWRNQSEITVPGRHFLQEDSGEAIGRGIAEWIAERRV